MFQFGIGGAFARRVSGNAATPDFPQRFATMQDVNVEFNQKLVPLRGQNKGPDDVAPSDMEIKGKSGFGAINVEMYNALFFADTVTDGINVVADREAQTVPLTTGAFTITVTNAADYVEDLGVMYANGDGYLQQVTAGNEDTGKYSVDEDTGIYTFDTGDAGKDVLISYEYADAVAGRTMTVNNHIQGYGPVFELFLLQPYQGRNAMHLFRCRASKMSAPMKRDNYLISDFEFEAFPGLDGRWFEWFQETSTQTS
jgi:hypothetical protein